MTMASATKRVYFFGNGKAEGRGDQKALLGGKGAGLAEMTNIGLPVPGGFTITTETCEDYYRHHHKWPGGFEEEIVKNLKKLEKACKKKLGDANDPLLVSVRSGAAVSMPGMMETILNLGLNDVSVEGLAKVSGNRRFALDAYRRLIMMYGATAKGVDRLKFDHAFDQVKDERTRGRLGIAPDAKVNDTDVNEAELEDVVERFKQLYADEVNEPFPQEPMEQLRGSINAVFESWNAEKAVTYRRVEKITGVHGTGVNICQMVFGNMGDDSGTGVCFTRDPSTGENEFYGEFLINAQGEDVVAGIRTPLKIHEMSHRLPTAWDQLLAVRAMLELHYGDMQDLEFTVERGKLYMLQCRTGKRSPGAAFRIAVEQATLPLLTDEETKRLMKAKYLPAKYGKLATKPVISKRQAVMRIKASDIEKLFSPVIDPSVSVSELDERRLGTGINAVPGAASGTVVFHAADAERLAAENHQVILVRNETSPEDVGGMHVAAGILTATGGKTSHAAVVARGWGKCCIVGCDALRIDESAKTLRVNGHQFNEGDPITLDGSTGHVYEGELPLDRPGAPNEYGTILEWADEIRRLKVRTNADTPADAANAVSMGAEGIGLCRTEHMFFDTEERRLAMQEMIVADDVEARVRALDKLQPFQKQDFFGIFEAMNGKPVTIRLVDPPLHEFLPHDDEGIERLANYTGLTVDQIRDRTRQLHESNPMLGHRGCRLAITYPEILDMQVSAIIEAAVQAAREGVTVLPEIMIPLTIDPRELQILVEQTRAVADAILDDAGVKLDYMVGTMVETPRAALRGDDIASVCQFISFGTNDLTQTTMGLSRDDAGRFLPDYVDEAKHGIFKEDPFSTIDVGGVGMLVDWAASKAREVDKKFKLGVCGEHGGDPESVDFFHNVGLDYVSCSPFRVPVARLAAAQAVVREKDVQKTGRKSTASASRVKKNGAAKSAKKATAKKATKKKAKAKKASKSKAAKSAKKKTTKKAKSAKKKTAKKAKSKKATAKKSKKKTAKNSKKTTAKKKAGKKKKSRR